MEQNTPKFRLRLNLFDGIILIAALAVGAFLLWNAGKPRAASQDAPQSAPSTVQYTVRFQRWREGTGEMIQPDDQLIDNIKNFELGQVVSTETAPAEMTSLDHSHRIYRQAIVEGYEDILVTVQAPCAIANGSIQVGGGFDLRVGTTVYIKGPGYMGSGPIVSIQREVAK